MASDDMTYTGYDQLIEQAYPVDPTLYENNSFYTGAEASTSYTQPYPQQLDNANDAPTSSDPNPFKCYTCGKSYKRQCDLDKHMNNHTKRRKCPIKDCDGGGAETKDLHRHLWAKHSDYAREKNIPRVEQPCGWPGCDYHGRTDNLKRHRDNHNHWPMQWS
ncbi:hypothetical protein QBC36DRAFT_55646 [Triangularia setosa]|uniref:pH-response transcription factor pacC/RIM101 n=1 Tax=Triangularia setosa TaxID=2587417 RepID=A0AAN6W150_9PEZI|nr:hypothetical protein QBC36DRAFT_55646 [Podospora setosa]